ncbi:transcription antitermination factor NusB [Stratiformator vulcanicus]|uniref:Ribosomal RNA small subunit methyltransferase B n=1 Tax=Stratiformator vulcanicus TaxID=2527980 RepID=A0A517R7K9_9PLAN|nr:transcription antitermination factor NusB [Stratiformator vulcanicus]QDT39877.1 Ribosomal RNA small subunit methyltransferase B [Stratiformator vulcanicus]
MTEAPPTARDIAYEVLTDRRRDVFAQDRLDGYFQRREVRDDDRRLATEIVYGIIRRQATLDAILRACSSRSRFKTEAELWTLLRIGVYQMAMLDTIPPHAAVHETIEVVKRRKKDRWIGFANAVLRKATVLVTDMAADEPGRDTFPLAGGGFRRCAEPVFPDPAKDPVGYFCDAFSFPRWMSERWMKRFGRDDLHEIGRYFDHAVPPSLRVNSLKGSREALLEEFQAAGVACRAGAHPLSIRLARPMVIDRLPGFAEGRFTVQDETAMSAADTLAPQPGQRILDLCAAPGTKTTHLAELMRNEGELVATDLSDNRVRRIERGCRRLSLTIVNAIAILESGEGIPPGEFDGVLVDAPCTNSGVLGKRPEARWRLKPSDATVLSEIQRKLLARALERTRSGGRVLYSTCSIEPEENEQVVQAVLSGRDEWRLESSRLFLPGRPSDGGFQALLVRDA